MLPKKELTIRMDSRSFLDSKKNFSLIGAGKVGRALATALYKKGWQCNSVVSRRRSTAEDVARVVKAGTASDEARRLIAARWIFVCTPDDVLPEIASSLAGLEIAWKDINLAHTSGSVTSEVFRAVRVKGAKVCSLHPAISLAGTPDDWQKICNAVFGIEGGEESLVQARELLHELGASAMTIPSGQKTAYHLACVLASNYLVTLHAVARQILQEATMQETELRKLLVQLSQDTLRNLSTQTPANALTGPIARGDAGTVAAHVELLKNNFPSLAELYVALGRETLKLSNLPPSTAQEFEKLFG